MSTDQDPTDLERTFRLLWAEDHDRDDERGERPALTASRIIDTAIDLADAETLEDVSMQRIGRELGYTAMALYRHVPGKKQLLLLMADAATGVPPDTRTDPGDWRAGVTRWANALWDVYRRHPWMLRIETSNAPSGSNELAWFEALLGPLSRAGLDGEQLVATAMFVSSAVRDLARISTELVPAGDAYPHLLADVVSPERFPVLTRLTSGSAFRDRGEVKPALDFGLSRLLDGIERG